jgi:hypothetical protein
MHAPKAPPSSLASPRPPLVPQTSPCRAPVVDALAHQRSSQRPVGSIPQSLRGGLRVGRRCLVAPDRYQAAWAAHGKARA